MPNYSLRRLLGVVALCALSAMLFAPVSAHAAGVVDADAGEHFSLAVLSDGSMWGWGYNAQGQLGDGTQATHLAPVVTALGGSWADVDAGWRHALAIRPDGTLWAWGFNKDGQLGIGHAEGTWDPTHWHTTPTKVGTAKWLEVAAGHDHSVGLDEDSRIWAWGANGAGQLGNGSTTPTSSPTLVSASPGSGRYWRHVWATGDRSLALASDGVLWQWGEGVGDTPEALSYIGDFTSPLTSTDWGSVSFDVGGVAAVLGDTYLWAWTGQGVVEPIEIGEEFRDIAETGDDVNHMELAMALRFDRSLWLATDALNQPQRLIDPDDGMLDRWLLIVNDLNWDKLEAGTNHYLISKTDGSLWGWGNNAFGQLGDGTEASRYLSTQDPVRTILPTPIPFVIGMTQSDAEDKIDEMGFKVGTVTLAASPLVPITHVISQTPEQDHLVMPGNKVNIVVSAGPPVPVPNVVGMTEQAARDALGAVGLGVLNARLAYSSIVPKGSVISVEPGVGTPVIVASRVELTVSNGPQPQTVPFTSGQTETLARSSLTSKGFVVGSVFTEYSTQYAAGRIIRTYPAAGVQGFAGDTVDLYVSLGKPKAWVGTPKAPSKARASRSFTVYGYLKPRHTKGTRPVRIYKWKKTKSGWKAYGYTTATASNYLTYTKYSRSIKVYSKGTWRFRAYAPADSKHAAAWSSGYDYVSVK